MFECLHPGTKRHQFGNKVYEGNISQGLEQYGLFEANRSRELEERDQCLGTFLWQSSFIFRKTNTAWLVFEKCYVLNDNIFEE